MPTEQRPGMPTSRRYTDQEKAEAVRLVRQLREELGAQQGTIQRVAHQLGYGVESVRLWVREADINDGLKPGTTTADADRVKELEQEVSGRGSGPPPGHPPARRGAREVCRAGRAGPRARTVRATTGSSNMTSASHFDGTTPHVTACPRCAALGASMGRFPRRNVMHANTMFRLDRSLVQRNLSQRHAFGPPRRFKELRRANEILKRASAFFAAELDRPQK